MWSTLGSPFFTYVTAQNIACTEHTLACTKLFYLIALYTSGYNHISKPSLGTGLLTFSVNYSLEILCVPIL